MRVVVAGAGNVGSHIVRELARSGHDVVAVDVVQQVLERLHGVDHVELIAGDACQVDVLQKAGMIEGDVLVAVTGDDEDNLVISLLAKQEFGVPRVVARVNHPQNQWLFNEAWGVDVAVSTPHILTALVEEAVSVGSLVRLLRLEAGAQLVEVTLAEDSPADDRGLAELAIPRGATIVAVVRRQNVIVPRGDTIVQAGDDILALVLSEAEEEDLKAVLIGERTAAPAARVSRRGGRM